MNLGTMKTALRRIAGVDSGDPLVDWINEGMYTFLEAYDWPFLQSTITAPTVVGSAGPIDAGASVVKIITARITRPNGSSYPLSYKPWIQWEEEDLFDTTHSRGEPQFYTLLGTDSIFLYPTPDLIYTLNLAEEISPAPLVNDVDEPIMHARYHYTIVRAAAVVALQAESEEDRADSALLAFEAKVEKHISRLGGNKQMGQFNTVRDVMGYGS